MTPEFTSIFKEEVTPPVVEGESAFTSIFEAEPETTVGEFATEAGFGELPAMFKEDVKQLEGETETQSLLRRAGEQGKHPVVLHIEDNWGETAANVVQSGVRGLTSIGKTFGELVDVLEKSPLARPAAKIGRFLQNVTGVTEEARVRNEAEWEESRVIMDRILADAEFFTTPNARTTRGQQIIGSISEQIGRLITGAATGNPLVTLSFQSAIAKTKQALDEGKDFGTATTAGIAQFYIEKFTEKGPLDELAKMFKGGGVKTLFKGVIKDTVGEWIAYFAERGIIDPVFLDKPLPGADEIVRDIQDLTMTSIGTMATVGTSAKGLTSANVALNKLINKEVSVAKERGLTREEILKKVTPVLFTLDEKTPIETEIAAEEAVEELDELKEPVPPVTPLEMTTKPDSTIDDIMPVIPNDLKPEKVVLTEDQVRESAEIAPIEKKLPPPTDIVDSMMRESKQEIHKLKGLTSKNVTDLASKWFLDVNHKPLKFLQDQNKETAHRAFRYFELIAHSDYQSNFEIEALRDKVLIDLNRTEVNDIDKFGFNVRHLEILKNNPDFIMPKTKDPKTGKLRRLTAKDMIESNANIPNLPKLFPRYKMLIDVFDAGLQEFKGEGIVDDAEIARLKESGEFYQPRKIIEFMSGPLQEVRFRNKTRSVHNNGMMALEEGSEKLIDTDLFFLAQNFIVSKNKRIATNKANKALSEFIEENETDPQTLEVMREAKIIGVTPLTFDLKRTKDNKIIKRRFKTKENLDKFIKTQKGKFEIVGQTSGGQLIFEDTPPGWQRVSFMEDGKQRRLFMRNDLAEGWIAVPPILSHAQAQLLQWVSGSKILGFFATGGNPDFAVRNPWKDMSLIWFVLGGKQIDGKKPVYSSFAPKFLAEMQSDIRAVAKDVINGTGEYKDMVMHGGGFGGMTSMGRITDVNLKAIKDPLHQAEFYMGWLNNQSENITRTAIYHRSIKNGFDKDTSAWIANSYLDFNKHGSLGQAAGNIRKYLNPSIQGTKNVLKEFKVNTKSALWKTGQIALTQTALRYLWKYMDDDEEISDKYNAISPGDRENNWCFPPMFSFTDENNNRRGVFLKIPKDQSQRLMTSLIDNTINLYDPNEEVDYDELKKSLKNALPVDPSATGIPLWDGIYGVTANFNWWAEKKISPEGIDPKESFTPYTHEFFVDVGEMTGWNPQKIEYFLQQYFTSNNFWTTLAGKGYKTVKRTLGKEERNTLEQHAVKQLKSTPLFRNHIGFTHPRHLIKRNQEKIANKNRTENFAIDREIQTFIHNIRFLQRKIGEKEQAGTDARDDRIRLAKNQNGLNDFLLNLGTSNVEKFEFAAKKIKKYNTMKDLVQPAYWAEIKLRKEPIEKAELYHHYLVNEPPELAAELGKDLKLLQNARLFGLNSEKFKKALVNIHLNYLKEIQGE